jgi:hypothetical protein
MIKASWVGTGRVLLVNAGIILVSAWIGVVAQSSVCGGTSADDLLLFE